MAADNIGTDACRVLGCSHKLCKKAATQLCQLRDSSCNAKKIKCVEDKCSDAAAAEKPEVSIKTWRMALAEVGDLMKPQVRAYGCVGALD